MHSWYYFLFRQKGECRATLQVYLLVVVLEKMEVVELLGVIVLLDVDVFVGGVVDVDVTVSVQ